MKKVKYLFLIMLVTFMSVSHVNAETKVSKISQTDLVVLPNSYSDNLLKMEVSNTALLNSYYIYTYEVGELEKLYPTSTNVANKYLIEVQPNTTYYYYSTYNNSVDFYFLKENLSFSDPEMKTVSPNRTFTTTDTTKYIFLVFKQTYIDFKNAILTEKFMLSQSDVQLDYVDYQDSPSSPEEPEQPEEPTINTDQKTILDNFYTIFVTKLKELAQFSSNNYLFLAFIGVLILVIVLELFFKILFLRGGRY